MNVNTLRKAAMEHLSEREAEINGIVYSDINHPKSNLIKACLCFMLAEISRYKRQKKYPLESTLDLMKELSEEQRLEVMSRFCHSCGIELKNAPCYCMSDE